MLLDFFDLFIVFTQHSLYFLILLNFLAVIALFWLVKGVVFEKFKEIDRKTLVFLLAILVFGFYLRLIDTSCTAPSGKTWEHVEYAERLLNGDFFLNRQDIDHGKGYPLLLSVTFLFFGRNVYNILSLNILFSLALILLVFLITRIITKHNYISLFSAFLFALMPASIIASRLGSEHNLALFFLSAAFYFLLVYLEKNEKKVFFLSIALLAMATHFRVESAVFSPIFLFLPFALNHKHFSKNLNALKTNFLIFLLFFSQFIAFFVLLPFIVGYVEDSRDPMVRWAHTQRHNPEETFDERFPDFGTPSLFSPALFPLNISMHFESLLNPTIYFFPLIFFALFSFIGFFKYRFVLPLILWILFFLVFFGLWWGSTITTPSMYQQIIIVPITVLILVGILVFWNFFSHFFEKLKIPKKFYSIVFILIVFSVFLHSLTFAEIVFFPVLPDEPEKNCFVQDLERLSVFVDPNGCIAASSKFIARMSDFMVLEYFFTQMEVVPNTPLACKKTPKYFVVREFGVEKEELLKKCNFPDCGVSESWHIGSTLLCELDC